MWYIYIVQRSRSVRKELERNLNYRQRAIHVCTHESRATRAFSFGSQLSSEAARGAQAHDALLYNKYLIINHHFTNNDDPLFILKFRNKALKINTIKRIKSSAIGSPISSPSWSSVPYTSDSFSHIKWFKYKVWHSMCSYIILFIRITKSCCEQFVFLCIFHPSTLESLFVTSYWVI